MRWIYTMTLMLAISGCATQTKYQQVFIPSPCEIQEREKPQRSGDIIRDLKAVLIYSELIKKDLDFCRGVK